MTEELSKNLINDLNRQFEAGLAKIKFEYQKNLQEVDPLDEEALEKMLTVFNQRLVIFQHEFMEYLSQVRDGVNPDTKEFVVKEFVVEEPPIDQISEIAAGILAGGYSAFLVAIIPVATKGWISITVVSAAAGIGGAIGAPAGVITAGTGVIVGATLGVVLAITRKKYRRKLIRNALIDKYDKDIAPKLRVWARDKIQNRSPK